MAEDAPVKVYELTEEEFALAKRNLILQLKLVPDWQSKLASCHVKCSDIDMGLAVALWMALDAEEIKELYREAGRKLDA